MPQGGVNLDHNPLLGPVVMLIGWSLVMLIWMVVTRMPAMKAVGIDLTTRVGSKPGHQGARLVNHSDSPDEHDRPEVFKFATRFNGFEEIVSFERAADAAKSGD